MKVSIMGCLATPSSSFPTPFSFQTHGSVESSSLLVLSAPALPGDSEPYSLLVSAHFQRER